MLFKIDNRIISLITLLVAILLFTTSCITDNEGPLEGSDDRINDQEETYVDPMNGEWVLCAIENEYCYFVGTALVRYGTENQYHYQTHEDGVECANSVFGDPNIGRDKKCYYTAIEDMGIVENGEDTREDEIIYDNKGGIAEPGDLLENIRYSGPVIIGQGGTYRGAWKSTSPDIPAVTIRTDEPVIIENSHTKSISAPHIKSDVGYTANLIIRNVTAIGISPNTSGQYPGRFIHLDTYTSLEVSNSYLEQTSGIYLHQSTDGGIVNITRNIAKNIDGRRSDGRGGYQGEHRVQFVQFDKGNNMIGTEISWNKIVNEPYNSRVEDVISVVTTSGHSNDPIMIHNNYIRGAYPADPLRDSYSGGGIMLGYGRLGNKYLHAFENHVVSTSNYGIAMLGGAHNRIYNNRIISCGYINSPTDGSRVFIESQNVGVLIRNVHNNPSFEDNIGYNNDIGWMNTTLTRNDWHVADAAEWTENRAIPGTPIPCNLEDEEYELWTAKIMDNNVRVGLLIN
ncbi:MAG: hypothetical protein ACMXYL_05410 [Candidatus Woesearchaeota archaeon]